MQAILSIDATSEPLCLQILQVDQRTVQILESQSVSVGDLFSRTSLFRSTSGASPIVQQNGVPVTETSSVEHGHAPPVEADGLQGGIDRLREALHKFSASWSTSVVLIPAHEYLSMNLDLPFGNAKNLHKILDLEIQDRVPFDLAEFVVEHRSLGQLPSKTYDVHVGLIPKICIRNILAIFRKSGVEPYLVSTPAGVLEALYYVAPNYFKTDSMVLFAQERFWHIGMHIDNQFRSDRIVQIEVAADHAAGELPAEHPAIKKALADVKLTVSVAENRYRKRIEQVYALDCRPYLTVLRNTLGRHVEEVDLAELVRANSHETRLASVAAVFAQDTVAPLLLTNFRSGEFAYSPQLRELMLGLRKLLPYFLTVLACTIIGLLALYVSREHQITVMRDTMHKRIQQVIPDAQLSIGKEAEVVLTKNNTINTQLNELGSPSRFSTLDWFLELSRNFPTSARAEVRRVKIQGNEINIEGCGKDYSVVEGIDKALKNSLAEYCRVRLRPTASGCAANDRAFFFELHCE